MHLVFLPKSLCSLDVNSPPVTLADILPAIRLALCKSAVFQTNTKGLLVCQPHIMLI